MSGDGETTGLRRNAAFLTGAVGAAVSALAGMFGLHDASVWRMPAVLEARVEIALQAAGFTGVDVRMQGQRASLSGVVADEAAVEAARRTALTAAGAGGPWAGGVTAVDVSQLQVGRPVLRTDAGEPEGGRWSI